MREKAYGPARKEFTHLRDRRTSGLLLANTAMMAIIDAALVTLLSAISSGSSKRATYSG